MSNEIQQKYGELEVLSTQTIQGRHMALCLCSCGKIKNYYVQHLKSGKSKSCGCYRKKLGVKWARIHGLSNTPEYKIWSLMNYRCKPNYYRHADYFDRGIVVCKRWYWTSDNKDAFLNFLSDMGKRPTPKHSIDRIDNNGIYEPSNCRWATAFQQRHNQRRTPEADYQI